MVLSECRHSVNISAARIPPTKDNAEPQRRLATFNEAPEEHAVTKWKETNMLTYSCVNTLMLDKEPLHAMSCRGFRALCLTNTRTQTNINM